MDFFNKKYILSVYKIVVIAFLVAIVIGSYIFFNSDDQKYPKINGILSGLITGIIVALIQLILGRYEFKKIERFEKMYVNDIMASRDDRAFYRDLIENARHSIKIMGVTADRFLNDFANNDSPHASSKILYAILGQNVEVKILLPGQDFLKSDAQKTHFDAVREKLQALKNQFQNLDYKYFDHDPLHSIFIVDDQCILGPVFPNVSSKDTPAIYLQNVSPYAKRYLAYFDDEWAKY